MIYLSYGIWENGVVTWVEPPVGIDAVRIEPKKRTDRINGYDLRQIPYTQLLSKRDTWTLSVSADEMMSEVKRNFMENFFGAHAWRYGGETFYYGYGMGYGYANVFLEDVGDMPVSWLDDDLSLPELTFKLIKKEPDYGL